MIARLATAVIAAALSTPAHADNYRSRGGDGYTRAQFKPQVEAPRDVSIELVVHASRAELQHAACDVPETDGGAQARDCSTLSAFNAYYPKTGRCVIHIVDPRRSYEPDQLGHEALHCWFGAWHDEGYRPVRRVR